VESGRRLARTTSGRRIAAVGLVIASCVALLATSPAIIESRLTASAGDATPLTMDAPRATGRVLLSLSAEAIPLAADDLHGPNGRVRFRLPSEVNIVGDVRPVGIDAVSYEEYGYLVFSLEQLCRVAEPCEREFEVTIEWTDPRAEFPTSASYAVDLEIVYPDVETNPAGATAALTTSASFAPAPAGPVVTSATEREQIVLDEDSWAAARHVTLMASQAALGGEIVAHVDWAVTQAPKSAVRVTILPDEQSADQPTLDPAFDPFASCAGEGDCERGVTVVFELDGPPSTAVVAWTLGLTAGFPARDAVPDGADLAAVIDHAVSVTAGSPRLTAEAAGTLRLPAPEPSGSPVTEAPTRGRHASVTVTAHANAAALPIDTVGAQHPLARAVLSVTATGLGDGAADLVIRGADATAEAVMKLSGQRPTASVPLNPLRGCARGTPCDRSFTITLNVSGKKGGAPGAVEIGWTLSLALPYPDAIAIPSGAEVTLSAEPEG